jgi:hypothetical protein
MALQYPYSGLTMVLQWPYSGCAMDLQLPYKGLKQKKSQSYIITHAQELHVCVALQFPYSGLTVAFSYKGHKQKKYKLT